MNPLLDRLLHKPYLSRCGFGQGPNVLAYHDHIVAQAHPMLVTGRVPSRNRDMIQRGRAALPPPSLHSMASDIFHTPPEADQRFRTLELAATECYDAAALARAMSRHAVARERTGQMASRLYGPPGSSPSAERDVRVRYTWHLWCSLPSQWRHDLTWPDDKTIVTVIRPDASLSYISGIATLYTAKRTPASGRARAQEIGVYLPTIVSNELANFPLLNPRLSTADWELVTLGREEFIGRVVRRVRATRWTGAASANATDSGQWPGVDEYECLVDDSLRMILRVRGVVDGMCVAATTVERLEVDRPLPPEVFDFMPPAGTRLVNSIPSE